MKQRCFVRLSRCQTTANYKQHPCTMMVPVVITAMLSLLYSVRGIKENRKERKRCSANNSDPHFPYLSLFFFCFVFCCIASRILIVFFFLLLRSLCAQLSLIMANIRHLWCTQCAIGLCIVSTHRDFLFYFFELSANIRRILVFFFLYAKESADES